MPCHEHDKHVMSFVAIVCFVLVIVSGQDARPDLAATRLQTGSFSFRTLVDGKEAGRSRIEIRSSANSGNCVFSNLVIGSFSQSWEAVASPTFAPMSAKLSFGQGSAARTVFELSYQGNRVSGFVIPQKEPSKRRDVNEAITDDTVDQRIDWAAVMALKEYIEGQNFNFVSMTPKRETRLSACESAKLRQSRFQRAHLKPCVSHTGLINVATPKLMRCSSQNRHRGLW